MQQLCGILLQESHSCQRDLRSVFQETETEMSTPVKNKKAQF